MVLRCFEWIGTARSGWGRSQPEGRVINFDNAYTFTLWRRKVIIYVDRVHAVPNFAFWLFAIRAACANSNHEMKVAEDKCKWSSSDLYDKIERRNKFAIHSGNTPNGTTFLEFTSRCRTVNLWCVLVLYNRTTYLCVSFPLCSPIEPLHALSAHPHRDRPTFNDHKQ